MRHRPTILGLNDKAANGNGSNNPDGEAGEIIDFLADDNTVDLDLKLDARRFLLGCPRRLVQIAYKRYSWIAYYGQRVYPMNFEVSSGQQFVMYITLRQEIPRLG